jgi:glycosyltransferase involved in cell wall biosynthesis
MDGGSTDDTLERVAPYKNRFSHYESGPDGGQSAAIAKGFEHSTGEIMAYLNSDDVLLPGTLNFVADYFDRHPDVDFIYGHRCVVNEYNQVIGHWILPGHSNFLMQRWDLIPQETCFWRRRLFERAGNVDPGFHFAMDFDLFVRFMRVGRFKRVNRFLAAFRVHQDAKTSSQMQTRGLPEINAIQKKYGIKVPPFLGHLFSLFVQIRSAHWVASKMTYPGLPSGKGFDLLETWGVVSVKNL